VQYEGAGAVRDNRVMNNDASEHRFSVQVHPAGWSYPASASQSLLSAALQAAIRLPSSCRNGTCRACMCRLVSGNVAYRIEWPGLSAEEKAEGFILPCVAQPLSDLVLQLPVSES
jgi:ferredoxin